MTAASFMIVILMVAAVAAVVAIGVAIALFVISTDEEKEEEEDRKRAEIKDDFVLPSSLKAVSPPKTTTLESTFNGKKIVVQAHARLAGGIWSFAVGGKPYVTELYGNGGSLQYACFANVDNPDSSKKAHSESYNPTQGGNARDKNGVTTSRWFDMSADKDAEMVFSKTQMAFYTDPVNPHANARDTVPVFNTRAVSDFVLDQFLHLGYRGEPNVLLARYVLNVPEKLTDHKHATEVTHLIAEMPTGYMHADFSRHLRWNVGAKTFEALPGDTGDNVDSRPELGGAVATPDGKHCMGVWCVKSLPRRVNVPRFSVSGAGDGPNPMYQSIRLNKWALTTSLGGHRRHFHGPITTEVLLVVGSLAEVTETFKKLGL